MYSTASLTVVIFSASSSNFDSKGFLERHHQFDLVEGIRSEVVHEGRRRRHFGFIDAELLDDNLFYALFHAGHSGVLRDLLSLIVHRRTLTVFRTQCRTTDSNLLNQATSPF